MSFKIKEKGYKKWLFCGDKYVTGCCGFCTLIDIKKYLGVV